MTRRSLFRSRHPTPFQLFWGAELLSLLADGILLIALPLHVFGETGSILATGLLFIAGAAPVALLGAVAGVYIDRWNRKQILIVGYAMSAAIASLLILASWLDALWLLYPATLLQASMMQITRIAADALLPGLVERERLMSANAFMLSGRNVAELLGPALSGVIMASAGFHVIGVLAVLAYASAAVSLQFVVVPTLADSNNQAARQEPKSSGVATLLTSVRMARKNRVVAFMVGIYALCSLGEGVFNVLFVPFVTEVLKGSAVTVGALFSAQALGGVLGGVILGRGGIRYGSASMLAFGALALGVIDLLLINSTLLGSGTLPAYVLMALAGFPAVAFGAGFRTLIQENVQGIYLGRVFGLLTATSGMFMVLGSAFAGIFGGALGIVPVIHLQVIVYVLAGVIVLACKGVLVNRA